MKKLVLLFGLSLGGIALCLVMTIVTSIQESRARNAPPADPIPLPALPSR